MSNLIQNDLGYPFLFFPEKYFYREQVMNYMVDLYIQSHEYYRKPVMCPAELIHNGLANYYLNVAKIARVIEFDEEYSEGPWGIGANEFIVDLYERCNGDILKAADQMPGAVTERKDEKLFRHDIVAALKAKKMFFLNSEISYDMLGFFREEKDRSHPFAEKNIDRLFCNLPIQRVW